ARSAGDQSTGCSSAIASAMRVVAKRASTAFASIAIAMFLADRLRHPLQRARDGHARRVDTASDFERNLLPRQAELDAQNHQFLLAPAERRERVLVGAQALLADQPFDRRASLVDDFDVVDREVRAAVAALAADLVAHLVEQDLSQVGKEGAAAAGLEGV